MGFVNVRRRRPKPDNGKKARRFIFDLLIKAVGETLKAKITRALAIGAVGGAAQYAAAPVPDPNVPRPQVEISAPVPARVDGAEIRQVNFDPDPTPKP